MGEVKLNPDAAFPVASIDKKSEKEARALPSREIRFSFAEVVKKVSGAVVNVYASKKIKASSPQQELLREFFGDAFSTLPLPPRVQQSLGSGVILREDGLVVTNNHVIDGANKIRIVTEDETEYDATVIVRDPRVDLAILKISGKNLPFINLVSMKDLQVGDLVCAVGNPFGLGQTVTMGCISALARDGFLSNDPRVFIQTDAAINRGNSGGALVTTDAKLAGINAFIFSKSGGSIGLSFAIPSDFLLSLLQAADNDGHVKRPWIGASYHSTS
ncbi:trypsin-like peptidase domain-containing protein, partial [Alphaproteobacteria bacterium]|nr:trypsin-like peptidase domain-containing protein [Alphaproteobacteria bacterium]